MWNRIKRAASGEESLESSRTQIMKCRQNYRTFMKLERIIKNLTTGTQGN